MKRLFVALSIVVAASAYSVPTFAIDGGVMPPECADQATKDKHPDWYRPGGYCSMYNGDQAGSGSTKTPV